MVYSQWFIWYLHDNGLHDLMVYIVYKVLFNTDSGYTWFIIRCVNSSVAFLYEMKTRYYVLSLKLP